jgi:hypothetical protein
MSIILHLAFPGSKMSALGGECFFFFFFHLFHFLLYSQHLEYCLVHSKCSRNVERMMLVMWVRRNQESGFGSVFSLFFLISTSSALHPVSLACLDFSLFYRPYPLIWDLLSPMTFLPALYQGLSGPSNYMQETGSHCATPTGFTLTVFLPQRCECWDYRCVPPCPASSPLSSFSFWQHWRLNPGPPTG